MSDIAVTYTDSIIWVTWTTQLMLPIYYEETEMCSFS